MGRLARCVAALGLLLVACGPVYETDYRLEPPAEPSATTRQCLAGCAIARDRCLAGAEDRLGRCEDRATLRQQTCEQQAQLDYLVCSGAADRDGVVCGRRTCPRPECPRIELAACEADNRDCFAACGGSVVEERRCVANCPS